MKVEVSDDVTDSWVTHWKGVEIPPAPRYVDSGELGFAMCYYRYVWRRRNNK